MDEGVIEGSENTGDTENELAYSIPMLIDRRQQITEQAVHTISGQRTERDVLLSRGGSLLGRHCDGVVGMEYGEGKKEDRIEEVG